MYIIAFHITIKCKNAYTHISKIKYNELWRIIINETIYFKKIHFILQYGHSGFPYHDNQINKLQHSQYKMFAIHRSASTGNYSFPNDICVTKTVILPTYILHLDNYITFITMTLR